MKWHDAIEAGDLGGAVERHCRCAIAETIVWVRFTLMGFALRAADIHIARDFGAIYPSQ